jgi:SAM-dependent MidA family methyltransferase
MAKLVCHGEKYTKGAISKIERHNERKNEHYGNKDIDPERSRLNYSLRQRTDKNYFAAIMKLLDSRNNPTGKKLRKDAIVLTEFIISSSNEFFDALPSEKQKEYFQASLEYLENLFGKKNTIYAVVHNDEHTPHLHFGFVPMTDDNRVCAKDVINRNILRQMQEELPQYLKKAGFDIERGEINSEAVHRTVKQYKSDMEKEKA